MYVSKAVNHDMHLAETNLIAIRQHTHTQKHINIHNRIKYKSIPQLYSVIYTGRDKSNSKKTKHKSTPKQSKSGHTADRVDIKPQPLAKLHFSE